VDKRSDTAWNRRRDSGAIGLTATRAAAGTATGVADTAGSCPQPPVHFDESIQLGPPQCAFLPALRQQLAFDPLQHCMPQLDVSFPASRSRPETYGLRRRSTRSPAGTERHVAKSVARKEARATPLPRCCQRQPFKPNVPSCGKCSTRENSPARLADLCAGDSDRGATVRPNL